MIEVSSLPKWVKGPQRILILLRARAGTHPYTEDLEQQATWLDGNNIDASYNDNTLVWTFYDEEDAVAFKLRFGL